MLSVTLRIKWIPFFACHNKVSKEILKSALPSPGFVVAVACCHFLLLLQCKFLVVHTPPSIRCCALDIGHPVCSSALFQSTVLSDIQCCTFFSDFLFFHLCLVFAKVPRSLPVFFFLNWVILILLNFNSYLYNWDISPESDACKGNVFFQSISFLIS